MAMYDVGYGLSEWEFYGQVMRQTFHEQKKFVSKHMIRKNELNEGTLVKKKRN